MPNSYVDYTVTGNQTEWSSVSLSYLLTSHIGVSITSAASGTVYTVAAADITVSETPNLTVTIDAAKYGSSGSVYVVASGDVVRIARTTPIDDLTRTFNDGSVLKASDLNAQSNQLLFSLQEQEDKGVGSLPVDTDNRYDAGNRIIKNVATPILGNHVATMQFVDDAIQAGGVQSLNSPESWSLTGNDFTDTGDDAVYDFPVAPASLEANTYIVEVSGVIQHPGDDYTITQNADDSVRITLLDQDNIVGTSEKVQIRNFGVSRGQALQPFISSSTAPAMKVQQGDGSSQNTMEFKDDGGTNQAAFTSDGKFRVGTGVGTAADQIEIRSSSTENSVEVGDYSSGNTAGVEIRQDRNTGPNDDYGQILVSGQSAISDSTKAVDVQRNGSSLFYVNYAGNVVNTGNITNSGTLTNTGLISTPAGLSVTAGSLTMSGGTATNLNGTTSITGATVVSGSGSLTLGSNNALTSTGNVNINSSLVQVEGGSGSSVIYPGATVQTQIYQTESLFDVAFAQNNRTFVFAGDEAFKVSITPKRADSKIILNGTIQCDVQNNAMLLFLRRFTDEAGGDAYLQNNNSGANNRTVGIAALVYDGDTDSTMASTPIQYVDTPGATRPIDYYLIVFSRHSSGNLRINRTGDNTNNTGHELGVSVLTATEIAQ